jgi:hypothetical protein
MTDLRKERKIPDGSFEKSDKEIFAGLETDKADRMNSHCPLSSLLSSLKSTSGAVSLSPAAKYLPSIETVLPVDRTSTWQKR